MNFVISDPKNPRVQSYAQIVEFPKFHVHHIGPANSENGNPMLNSQLVTSETFEYKVPRKSLGFQNIMSSILGPPFWIPKIWCQIRNQQPQKPWSTKSHDNRWVSNILCPPYWVRHFEFRKSDIKFIISHPESF